MAYALPDLAYAYDALEPAIDEATMRLHHDKHHRSYVDATNKALEPYPQWQGMTIEELLQRLPDDIARAVVFVASDAASFITGSTLLVDGGEVASGGAA